GLATYLLHRECPPGADPLAPVAPLIFSLSPLVGTPLTTSAKFAVVAKSPLTDRLNDALSSSHFALAAKRAGFDALVLVGACPAPQPPGHGRGAGTLAPRRRPGGPPRRRDGAPPGRAAGPAVPRRGHRPGRRKPGALRHDQPREPPRRPGRPRRRDGGEEAQGGRGRRRAARRGGRPGRRGRRGEGAVAALVRPGDGEVPRAGHGRQPADVQPLRRAADAQLSAGHLRGGGRAVRRGVERGPPRGPAVVRGL